MCGRIGANSAAPSASQQGNILDWLGGEDVLGNHVIGQECRDHIIIKRTENVRTRPRNRIAGKTEAADIALS